MSYRLSDFALEEADSDPELKCKFLNRCKLPIFNLEYCKRYNKKARAGDDSFIISETVQFGTQYFSRQ